MTLAKRLYQTLQAKGVWVRGASVRCSRSVDAGSERRLWRSAVHSTPQRGQEHFTGKIRGLLFSPAETDYSQSEFAFARGPDITRPECLCVGYNLGVHSGKFEGAHGLLNGGFQDSCSARRRCRH